MVHPMNDMSAKTQPSHYVIEAQNVFYEYPGKQALRDVSFTIRAGSITALVGPNGAGKTTLMRCIAALEDPFSGTLLVDGLDTATNPREVHERIGYLSDFFGLYDGLTLRQSLHYAAGLHGIPEPEQPRIIEELVQRIGLGNLLDKEVGNLSRGQRQRAGIAQAVIHKPKLLLLDEPAAGLDPEARVTLSKLFLALQAEGMTLVVSSHILSELEDYCTDMLYLRDGAVLDHRKAEAKEGHGLDGEGHLIITLTEAAEAYAEKVKSMAGVSQISLSGQTITCAFSPDAVARKDLLKLLVKQGIPVCGMEYKRKRLQDVYMEFAEGDGNATVA